MNVYYLTGCVFVCIGRALEWHSRGQRFDPLRLHHSTLSNYFFARFLKVGVFVFMGLLVEKLFLLWYYINIVGGCYDIVRSKRIID